ncbi:hypothetical protein LTR56_022517 [Elasticomyces elasticus]|nr:hypothetical protein LTR56_022517 [Elasticomyces elasticus]KAK3632029.1 hypothetical protein LTR22_020769 [Elasticomyces elasticus]KAK4910034.1 hypothetical protein LTR49_021232 [Elasticomyces elasticus]
MDDDTVYCITEFLSVPIDVRSELQNEQYILDDNDGAPAFKRGTVDRWKLRAATPEISKPKLAMRIDKASMKDPQRGHTFGSDRHVCDVLLDLDNERGVSAQQFRLLFDTEIEQPQKLEICNTASMSVLHMDRHVLVGSDHVRLKPGCVHHVQAGPGVSFLITFLDRHLTDDAWTELRAAASGDKRLPAARNIKKLRGKPTPSFPHSDPSWVTHPGIPYRRGIRITMLGILHKSERSTVRKAQRHALGKTVAVKIIGQSNDTTVRVSPDEMQRELGTMLKLEHIHIIPLLDYAVFEDDPYTTVLVLELALYGTVREELGGDRNTNDLTRTVSRQVLDGLKYLHEQTIIHRDINPDNILIIDNEHDTFHCKIADFSHAQNLVIADLPTDVQGTGGCMSLECAKGKFSNDKTDVYACGKVAFWLLTGTDGLPRGTADDPSTAVSDINAIVAHLESWDPLPELYRSDVSAAGRRLICSMLDNNSIDRLSAKACLQHQWFVGPNADADDEVDRGAAFNTNLPPTNAAGRSHGGAERATGESDGDAEEESESEESDGEGDSDDDGSEHAQDHGAEPNAQVGSRRVPTVPPRMGSLAVNDVDSSKISRHGGPGASAGNAHSGVIQTPHAALDVADPYGFTMTGTQQVGELNQYELAGTDANMGTLEPWMTMGPHAPELEADLYGGNYSLFGSLPNDDFGFHQFPANNAYVPGSWQDESNIQTGNAGFEPNHAFDSSSVPAQYATQWGGQQPTLLSPSTTHDNLFAGTVPGARPSSTSSRQQPSPTQRGDASRFVGKRR